MLWWCETRIIQIPRLWTLCFHEVYDLSPYTEAGKYLHDRFIPHTQNWASSNFYHVIIFSKISLKKKKEREDTIQKYTVSSNIRKATDWSVNLHISKTTKSLEERWLLTHLINLSNFLLSQNRFKSTLYVAVDRKSVV